jgi:hypothetical protein
MPESRQVVDFSHLAAHDPRGATPREVRPESLLAPAAQIQFIGLVGGEHSLRKASSGNTPITTSQAALKQTALLRVGHGDVDAGQSKDCDRCSHQLLRVSQYEAPRVTGPFLDNQLAREPRGLFKLLCAIGEPSPWSGLVVDLQW